MLFEVPKDAEAEEKEELNRLNRSSLQSDLR